MSIKLIDSLVDMEKIEKKDYASVLKPYQKAIADRYDYIWKVTITPRKAPKSAPCQVVVSGAANLGNVLLDNLGRVPYEPFFALPGTEDLRPCQFLVFGKGTHNFKIMVRGQTWIYKDTFVNFE